MALLRETERLGGHYHAEARTDLNRALWALFDLYDHHPGEFAVLAGRDLDRIVR